MVSRIASALVVVALGRMRAVAVLVERASRADRLGRKVRSAGAVLPQVEDAVDQRAERALFDVALVRLALGARPRVEHNNAKRLVKRVSSQLNKIKLV